MKAIKVEVRKGRNDGEVVQKGPYTFAQLSSVVSDDAYIGIGFSKCLPTDELNPALGKEIAVGRAVHDIACQIREKRDNAKPKRTIKVWDGEYGVGSERGQESG